MTDSTAVAWRLRPIVAEDDGRVAAIIRQVMTEFGCVGPGFSIEDSEVDAMSAAYADDQSVYYVLEGPDGVAGCGGIAPLAGGDGTVCELKKMYYLPEARGHGMGRRLVEQCIAAARQRGYQRMYLETVARMEGANQL